MKVVIVPNHVSEAIHKAIDKALDGRPVTQSDKEILYNQLLMYFDEHGTIPEFELERVEE